MLPSRRLRASAGDSFFALSSRMLGCIVVSGDDRNNLELVAAFVPLEVLAQVVLRDRDNCGMLPGSTRAVRAARTAAAMVSLHLRSCLPYRVLVRGCRGVFSVGPGVNCAQDTRWQLALNWPLKTLWSNVDF